MSNIIIIEKSELRKICKGKVLFIKCYFDQKVTDNASFDFEHIKITPTALLNLRVKGEVKYEVDILSNSVFLDKIIKQDI